MKGKAYFRTLAAGCIVCVGVVTAMTVITDPYVRFHMPNKAFVYQFENENTRLFAPGYAKQADFSAAIVGTSHSMNFDPLQTEALWGVPTQKLPLQGATVHELRLLLDIAYDSGKQLDYVFCNIELDRQYNKVEWDYISEFNPGYNFDFDYLSQMRYLFNGDTFRNRVLPMWKKLLRGEKGYVPSKSFFGYTQHTLTMGPDAVLKDFAGKDMPVEEIYVNEVSESEIENVHEIVQKNYCELIEAHPETEFYFYIPPYSIAWWGNSLMAGDMQYLQMTESVYIEELSQYDNVKIFDFNTCHDWITDLNNYSDITHYGEWINADMMEAMYYGDCGIDLKNYQSILSNRNDFVRNYDYDSLFDQEDLPDPEPKYSE